MSGMVMTTMATACVLNFLEVEGEVVEEAAAVEEEEWDPRGQGMVPPPDALSTEFWCQVSDVFLLFVLFISPPKCIDGHLTPPFSVRSSSQWKLAGFEGPHARGR